MKFIRFDDWRRLPGAAVEVWHLGTLQGIRIVETATEDSNIVWVAADASGPRKLLQRRSGYVLRIHPEEVLLRTEHRLSS